MVFHRDDPNLAGARYTMLLDAVRATPLRNARPFLEAAGVERVLSLGSLKVPWLAQPMSLPSMAGQRLVLARLSPPGEPVWWVPVARKAPDTVSAFRQVRGAGFDPRVEVVLEEAPVSPLRFGPAEQIGRYRVRAPRDGWLYITTPWAPGMEVLVDGNREKVALADVAFMAVPVSRGRHEIRLLYRPPEVIAGILVSLGTLAVLLLAAGCAKGCGTPGPGASISRHRSEA
jgi:hypothetical protein